MRWPNSVLRWCGAALARSWPSHLIGWVLVVNYSCFGSPAKKSLDAFPPRPLREVRGAWIATVANLDWPSKPGLSRGQQQAELIAILDKAVQLHLNVLLLQVRPACDAFYLSTLEPWSEFLSGQ